MADITQMQRALVNAHNAGDVQAAQAIASALKSMQEPVDTKSGGDFLDRLGASFKMTNAGKIGYLENSLGKGNARLGGSGEIEVKKNGKWTQFDEAGFGVGDIADFAADVPAMIGGALGAGVGAAGAGVGSVPGAAAGAAAGAAVRQGIAGLLPGNDDISLAGRVGDVALNAAFSGAGQKVGNVIASKMAQNTAKKIADAGMAANPNINVTVQVEGLLDNAMPDWRGLSSEAKKRAVEYATRAVQSGAPVDAKALTNKALLEGLPVPINNATKGQLGRDFFQQQNENMLADIPVVGAKLRDVFEGQQPALAQNIDALFEKTGAVTKNARDTGLGVKGNLLRRYGDAKAATKAAYEVADAVDGQMPASVTDDLVKWLDSRQGYDNVGGVITQARKLGVLDVDEAGNLIAGNKASLRDLYELRKSVSKLSKTNGMFGEAKTLIDSVFDNSGSKAYQVAAGLRKQQGDTYEQGAKVVSDLIKTKNGATDAAVNASDVFDRVVLRGNVDDIRNLKKMLLSGDKGVRQDGWQQLKNLRGETINYLKSQAVDDLGAGEVAFKQGGLQRAIDRIGYDNLEEVLGKSGAKEIKTLAEAAKLLNKSKGNRTVGSATAPRLAQMAMSLFDRLGAAGTVLNTGVRATQARNALENPANKLLKAEAVNYLDEPTLKMLMGATRLGGVALTPDDYR